MQLIAIRYSPWSEKARWALDHKGLSFNELEHLPIFGEPTLRLKLRLKGKISVPILVDGKIHIEDSFHIAQYADASSSNPSLFPKDELETIRYWNSRSEEALEAARALVIHGVENDAEAQREAMPPLIPKAIAGAFSKPIALLGTAFLKRKYPMSKPNPAELKQTIADVMSEWQDARRQATGLTLFDEFSFADLAMATVVQSFAPVDNKYIKLGPGTRRCWTHESLASQFANLVDWRDQIYQTYR